MPEQVDKVQKYTNCWVTINTNKTDPSIMPAFKKACADVFNNIPEYIDIKPGHSLDTHIDNIEVEYRREIAPKTKTIHVHALIKINHHSHIKLLTREMKEAIRKLMGITTDFHLDVKYLKAAESELTLRQYLRKNQPNI